ncbi:MAG: universal stress protein, partial [Actinomycetota bacterium]
QGTGGGEPGAVRPKGGNMRGTMICGVTDSDEGRGAVELGIELSVRLDMRLVLAHVVQGFYPHDVNEDGPESATRKGDRIQAERLLTSLAEEYGVTETAERRSAVGDRAALLGQIAAEEAADVILVGSRARGWRGKGFESKLAEELESATPVPILIAPPSSRHRGRMAAPNGVAR